MGYTHLTAGERYQIEALLGKQCSLREIASRLGRDKGTISREIRRNRGQRGYRPQQAATFAMDRRQHACNARQIDPEVWLRVEAMLRLELSPVQISGRLKRKKLGKVSHETIYRRVYAAGLIDVPPKKLIRFSLGWPKTSFPTDFFPCARGGALSAAADV
jgi:IS30 family transposase